MFKETLFKERGAVIRTVNPRLPQRKRQSISQSPISYLILPQIKTPSGEIRQSSEGVLWQDVIKSERVRSLQDDRIPYSRQGQSPNCFRGFFNGLKETCSRLDACQSERISFRQRILPTNRQSEWDIRAESSWLGKEIRGTGRGLFPERTPMEVRAAVLNAKIPIAENKRIQKYKAKFTA